MPIKSSSFSPVYNTNTNGDLVVEVLNSSSGSAALPPNAATATNQTTTNNLLSPIGMDVNNLKSNVASILPFLGLDVTAIRALLPASLGAKTAANSLSITPASDAIFSVTQATPPAFLFETIIQRAANTTTYAINDVYGAAFELVSNPAPSTGQFLIITDIEILWNTTTMPSGMSSFALYLYRTPPSAVADNGAFSIPVPDRVAVIYPSGILLNAFTPRGGGVISAQVNNLNLVVKLTGTSLFAYLVTLGSFTPATPSETAIIRMRALAA
jgi:hypothetical protein